MVRFSMVVAVLVLQGCTAVYYVKRDDCWIRESKPWHGVITEDLGPCTRPAPNWSEDRFTRLMQECVAQSDYRWQHLALDAWKRGEPIPDRDGEEKAEACAAQAATTVLSENEALQVRVVDVTQDRERLQNHNEHLANVLGEAANKPAGSAIANATAHGEGTARGEGVTRHNSDSSTASSTESIQQSTDTKTDTHKPPAPPPAELRLGSTVQPSAPATPAKAKVVNVPEKPPVPESVESKESEEVMDAVMGEDEESALPFPTTIPAADEQGAAAPPDCP